ncbi:DUF5681 domain-containing protein [Ensifer sp. ENS05]|uniref:DUF5681 domain-containing protein n=1 Tax=Ensifer sp. ENS05 TaxID=2769277 RepID=UPI001FEFDDBC|nr:DUF5681 domain-containing protein [Ensifer sp. ENS05]
MAEDTGEKLPAHLRDDLKFKVGQSGNPAGRPKGARSKLGEAFLEAMNKDFEKHGSAVIAAVRKNKPEQYLRVVASILPKDLNVNINNLDNLTDEQLTERIRELSSVLGPFLAAAGTRGPDGGVGAETADQSAGEVPTIQ